MNRFSLRPEVGLRTFLTEIVLFALFYGFILINFIDSSFNNNNLTYGPYYHFWLIAMYFAPFVLIGILLPDHWEIFVALGLLASIMNDGLWGFWHILVGDFSSSQFWSWLYQWYVPTSDVLFDLSLGVKVPVYGWMMALSIYGRAVVVGLLLRKWWREPWES